MKVLPSLLPVLFPLLVAGAGCSKETKTKTDATKAAAAEDTMLMKDLAEANKNTAAAAAVDNSLNTVRTGADSAPSATPQNRSNDASITQPTTPSSPTTAPRLTVPVRANDAPRPTTVPVTRSPASSLATRSSRDPCDSPTLTDQRYCLNRLIVQNDADLNRTYQELIDQARKSGGSELEERFRQSQRDWVNQRDADCTAQAGNDEGKLWARSRARCLASYSTKRTAELNRNLNSLRGQ